jgi:opacity protein-like surface antigen
MKKHERFSSVPAEPSPILVDHSGLATELCLASWWRRIGMAGAAFLLAVISFLPVRAVEVTASKGEMLRQSHQVGVRLGVWSNAGDKPVASNSIGSLQYVADINDATFYAEFYLGIRVMRPLMVEVSAGITNRGDVTVRNDLYDYYGNISLYPINVRLKLYPFAGTRSSYQPYLLAGGGMHIGKNNIQFSTDYYAAYNERSVTDFNFVVGGGLDWPVSTKVALDLQAAYLPTTFSKELFGSRDYSGVTVTVGVKYLLPTLHGKTHQR